MLEAAGRRSAFGWAAFGALRVSVPRNVAGVHHTASMTTRITVSLPDDVHADLVRVASASNISASAVVRAVLSDLLPRMTGILEFIGTVTPESAAEVVKDVDAWTADLRTVLHSAPDAFEGFRTVMDEGPEGGGES